MYTRELAVESHGRTLQTTLFHPDTDVVPGVLCFPGYRSHRKRYHDHALALASEAGAACLTVDISGHGDTPGDLYELTEQNLYEDAIAAYDALSTQPGVNTNRIGIVATSFGSHLAVRLTRDRNPKSLLLRAPSIKEPLPTIPEAPDPKSQPRGFLKRPAIYDVMNQVLQSDDHAARLKAYLPQEGLLRIISDYDGAITVVESEQDENVAHEYIEAILEVAKQGTHRIIKGAKHVLEGEQHLVYRRMILEWAQAL